MVGVPGVGFDGRGFDWKCSGCKNMMVKVLVVMVLGEGSDGVGPECWD